MPALFDDYECLSELFFRMNVQDRFDLLMYGV